MFFYIKVLHWFTHREIVYIATLVSYMSWYGKQSLLLLVHGIYQFSLYIGSLYDSTVYIVFYTLFFYTILQVSQLHTELYNDSIIDFTHISIAIWTTAIL